MTVVGDAWVNIRPNFAGFKDQVTTGVNDAVKASAVEAQAATDALSAAEDNLAAAQEREAAAAARASDAQARLLGAQREATAAAEAQAAAQDGDTAAADRVAGSQLRLEAAQSRNSAAALGLAGAQRNTRAATDEVAGAQDRATEAHGRGTGALQTMSNIGGPLLLGIAGGVGAVAVGSLVLAGNFQEATTRLVTGAGESESALGMVRQGILDMAGAVGQSPQKLAEGLFMIESAGFHGADGLNVLRAAAEGAKVGNSDMETTANAVTTVMNDYHLGANQAADATNFLVTVVSMGKTHMEDLASSMQQILPIASSLHVPLDQVGGAMASLTERGVPADRAATALRFTMGAMVNEAPKGRDALANIGLSADDLRTTLTTKGLLPAMQEVQDAIGKKFPNDAGAATAALADITGGQRGLTAALGLTGEQMGTFIGDTANITGKMQGAHGQVLGWKTAQQDLNTQLDQAKATGESLGVTIGNKLLPVVLDLMHGVQDTIGWFRQHQTVAEGLGAALGTLATVFIGARLITAFRGMIGTVRNAIDVLGGLARFMLGMGPAAEPMRTVGTVAQTSGAQIEAAGTQAVAGGNEFAAAGERAATGSAGFTEEATAAQVAAGRIGVAGGEAEAGGLAAASAGGRFAAFGAALGPAVTVLGTLGAAVYFSGQAMDASTHATEAATKQINLNKAGNDSGVPSYGALTGAVDKATSAVRNAGTPWWDLFHVQGATVESASQVEAKLGGTPAVLARVRDGIDTLSRQTGIGKDALYNFATQTGLTLNQLAQNNAPDQVRQHIADIANGVIPAEASVQSLALIIQQQMNHGVQVTATAGQQIDQSVSQNFGQVAATIGHNMQLSQTTTQAGSSAMLQIWSSFGNQQLANTSTWTRQMNDDFGLAMQIAAIEFQTGGQTSVDNLAAQLHIGRDEASRILDEFDLRFGATANNAGTQGAATGSKFGDAARQLLVDKYGPFSSQVAAYEIALNSGLGPIAASIKAADPNSPIPDIPIVSKLAAGGMVDKASLFIAGEAGPEAVISFDPGVRQANIGYWAQAGKQLGIRGFQDGGFTDPSQVPKPPALTPEYGYVDMSFGLQGQHLLDHEYAAAVHTAQAAAAKLAAAAAVSSAGGDPFGGGPIKAYMLGEVAKRWPGVAEAAAFDYVEMREAGYNPNAQNPTSSAAGLAQNISGFGPGYERGNVQQQTAWMLNYIAGRYGDPIGAAAHERSAGWYDLGGILPAGGLGINTSALDEVVLPAGAGDLLGALGSILGFVRGAAGGGGMGGGSIQVTHAPNITVQGGATAETVAGIRAELTASEKRVEDMLVRELGLWGFRATPSPGVT